MARRASTFPFPTLGSLVEERRPRYLLVLFRFPSFPALAPVLVLPLVISVPMALIWANFFSA